MKKKKYLSRTVKLVCFFLALILSCLVLQHYVLRNMDHNSLRIDGFYQEDADTLDVVFVGASDIYTSFIPGRAYDKYGFTSYLLASESITTEGVITAVKEIVRTQHPGRIVVEANAFLYGKPDNDKNQAHIHKFFDNLPLSENKLEYIQKNVPADEQAEYFFPLMKYHGTWTEYPARFNLMASNIALQVRGYNYLKGFRSTTKILNTKKRCLNDKIAEEDGKLPLDPTLKKRLLELLDYCDEQKLDVVFVRAPHFVTDQTYDRVKRSNQMADIVEEHGYHYYEIENVAYYLGINSKNFFYNEDHMNIYGAMIFTDFLCECLTLGEKLEPDALPENQKEGWQKAAETANRVCHYCDDMIKKGELRTAQEDVITLTSLGDYSDKSFETEQLVGLAQ